MTAHTPKLNSRTFGFGNKAVFFCQVELQPDEEDRFASPEEAISWGSLELWAGGQNLCAHYEGTALLERVSWYLLPFFEWITANWDFLLHEQRPPVRFVGETGWESLNETNHPDFIERMRDQAEKAAEENYEWSERHRLWSCREGGLFPDIVFRRDRDAVEISWGQRAPAGAPINFKFVSAAGAVRVAPDDIARALHAVLTESCAALRAFLPASTRIRTLERRIQRLAQPTKRDLRMAILAGLGNSLTQWRRRWKHLQTKLEGEFAPLATWFSGRSTDNLVITGSCDGALMFGSAAPTLKEDDVFTIAETLVNHSKRATKRDQLAEYARETPIETKPYQEGYRLAVEWAETSGLWKKPGPVAIEDHLQRFGITVMKVELGDTQIGGVAVARTSLSPLILVNTSNQRNSYPSGYRFSLAHELCHLLHDRGHGKTVALISGPWAPPAIEKRANAFAAMLLMPDRALQEAFTETGGTIFHPSASDAVNAARWLHVSPDALIHHLENRGWIDHSHRMWLERKRIELEQQFYSSEKPPVDA